MKLFLRIFLSFWVAQALFMVLAILATVAMRPARQISAVEALQGKFLNEAVETYRVGGAEKLRDYLHTLGDTQHIHSILFDEHGPLTGRARPWFYEIVNGQRRTADTFLGRMSPHFQMLKAETTTPDGHHYILETELPPGQSAFFGPNGLPWLGLLIAISRSGLVCYLLAGYLTSPILTLLKPTHQLAAG